MIYTFEYLMQIINYLLFVWCSKIKWRLTVCRLHYSKHTQPKCYWYCGNGIVKYPKLSFHIGKCKYSWNAHYLLWPVVDAYISYSWHCHAAVNHDRWLFAHFSIESLCCIYECHELRTPCFSWEEVRVRVGMRQKWSRCL